MSDFDADAADLRAGAADLGTDVEVLAAKLEAALPSECRVARRARGLFDRRRVVEGIEVRLGEARYALRVGGGEVAASREQEVRGVVIKREPLALGDWLRRLEADLRERAQTSAQARAALERLLA